MRISRINSGNNLTMGQMHEDQAANGGKEGIMKKEEQELREVEKERENEITLEEAFGQIEEVISRLEAEEITLEQSFQEYNKGMKLLQYCNETIDRVEKKVLQINENGGLDEF